MPDAIGLIVVDLQRGPLGLPSRAAHVLAGRPVLAHVVARLAKIKQLKAIVLLHPPGQDPESLLRDLKIRTPLRSFPAEPDPADVLAAMRIAARKWALGSWRGGLGGATCYDELLPASRMLAAMEKHAADAAVIVGGDWPLIDTGYSRQALELHLQHPEAMQMTFTQAPPGLAGIVVARDLVKQFAQMQASFGQPLSYNPRPQADPIGKDVCVQIPAAVRSCARRFIYDTPRSAGVIDRLAQELGPKFADADALQIVEALAALTADDAMEPALASLPQDVTLELTTRRKAAGPILPQFHMAIQRPDMPLDRALAIVEQLGSDGDTLLTLGGLGDPLLHDDFDRVLRAARDGGVLGVAVETDLIVDEPVLQRLLDASPDIVSIRLNADRAATYRALMAAPDDPEDRFAQVLKNLQWLLNTRNTRWSDPAFPQARAGIPWLVPHLIKTTENLPDMETFYDRWLTYTGHAVIAPAQSGCGLMPEQSPVEMAPPRRRACRQLARRLTIHSDGRVARCDQDWLTRAPAGDTAKDRLADIWRSMLPLRKEQEAGKWAEMELCGACREWHRP